MQVLLTYDISDKHPEVKAALQAKNYLDFWTDNSETFYLPNTSLWKSALNISTTSVKEEFEKVIADINAKIPLPKDKIKIKRCIAVSFSEWDAILGEKHSDN